MWGAISKKAYAEKNKYIVYYEQFVRLGVSKLNFPESIIINEGVCYSCYGTATKDVLFEFYNALTIVNTFFKLFWLN